ncbi:protein FAR1-RELATED SEQUENCE 5-like [Coffea eugenioides]|uniref:protein FAR1-RELATED SEQUENCE 5-like n=1 Tax=Coffea eugenioides TaxID=49369 RepID=UPI000F60A3FF|nr:protein FAR1-RELATED SEQUENCE 5-like [Coffea eugenioides]
MAFLRENFFNGMRSTQRCEKMHQVLKLNLTPQLKLYECVQAYDLAVARLRHEKRRLRTVKEHTTLLPATQLQPLERHASNVFTRTIYIMVRKEMKKQEMYYRYNGSDNGITAVHYLRHPYIYSEYMVSYDRATGNMNCSCLKLEMLGLPYCHMFRAMLFEKLQRIPQNCIMKRWTRHAKEGTVTRDAVNTPNSNLTEMTRSRLRAQMALWGIFGRTTVVQPIGNASDPNVKPSVPFEIVE